MNQPLVSVVIPIYNVEEYLDRCIASVVNQTYKNLEIILVDDGSPDRCPEMCEAWARKDNRIRVIHKKNAGLGMARNSGIEAASGKFIFFFDSDDYVDLATVETCVRHATEQEADVVMFGRWDVYDDGEPEESIHIVRKRIFRDGSIQKILLPKLFTYELGVGVSSCGKMYDLETIRANHLRFRSEREIISEDAYFALEFFSTSTCAVLIPDNFYYYCKRSNSLTQSYLKGRQEKNDYFLETCLAYIAQAGLPGEVASHLKARYHAYTIAAMKQVVASDLSGTEKEQELLKMFNGTPLRRTLTGDVLRSEKPLLRLFFTLVKLRCHRLCLWMLKCKMKK